MINALFLALLIPVSAQGLILPVEDLEKEGAVQAIHASLGDKFSLRGGTVTGPVSLNSTLDVVGKSTFADLVAVSSGVKAGWFEVTGTSETPPVANRLYKENIVKAWIVFQGTGTPAIIDSFNVALFGEDGTGDYTVTWDVDFTGENNYALIGTGHESTTVTFENSDRPKAGSVSIITFNNHANAPEEIARAHVVAVGRQ